MSAADIIRHLDMQPHPEGGHYKETWTAPNGGRPTGTCIYFLLQAEEHSHW
ncbi:MAG: cupin domain-containing protein, partial [Rhodobacteraceae bacterium]|nr:cupin domain-containing protein [Paracoccaceae bacterium]